MHKVCYTEKQAMASRRQFALLPGGLATGRGKGGIGVILTALVDYALDEIVRKGRVHAIAIAVAHTPEARTKAADANFPVLHFRRKNNRFC